MGEKGNCLSNALHSSVGQNIKSLACPVSGLRSPVSDVWYKSEKLQLAVTQQRVIRSTSCFVLGWVFFSKNGLALFNLTAHELHELYYDRPTSWGGIVCTVHWCRVAITLCDPI